jgi:hypothetical protein
MKAARIVLGLLAVLALASAAAGAATGLDALLTSLFGNAFGNRSTTFSLRFGKGLRAPAICSM